MYEEDQIRVPSALGVEGRLAQMLWRNWHVRQCQQAEFTPIKSQVKEGENTKMLG